MNKENIKRYITLFHERNLPEIKPREIVLSSKKGKAIGIIGPRRVGKTYLLFSLIKDKSEQAVYLNFENPLLYGIGGKDFPSIVDAYFDMYPENVGKDIYFMLDEIQNVPEWEIGIRYLLDEGFYVFFTGSSSKLLSEDISKQMRGRTLTYTILPLSFKEFLKFKNVEISKRDLYGREVHKLKKLVEEYMEYGGFPEVVLFEDKVRILEEYLSVMIKKDIMERYAIRHITFMDALIRYIVLNYAKYASYSSIYKTFRERYEVSKRTVIDYLKALEDSFFVFFLPKYSRSPKDILLSPKKIYLIDMGFALFSRKSISRDMENVVFIELLRKKYYENPLLNIHYWTSKEGEVDFVLTERDKVKELIQVTYSLEDSEDREVKGLINASNLLKCKNLTIITLDEEKKINYDKLKINVLPIWKWLLSNKKLYDKSVVT